MHGLIISYFKGKRKKNTPKTLINEYKLPSSFSSLAQYSKIFTYEYIENLA